MRKAIALLACVVALAAAACDTPTPEQQRQHLFAVATAERWGPEQWANFAAYAEQQAKEARFADLVWRAEQCDREALEGFIHLAWGSDADYLINVIIPRESGWNCAAKNPRSTASGLTQQLDIHAWRYARRGWDWNTDRFNGVRNLEIAYELFSESGWAPWRCC